MCRLHTAQYRECDEWKERKETVYWRIQEKKKFQKERSKHLKMKIECVLAADENIIRMNKPKVKIAKIQ